MVSQPTVILADVVTKGSPSNCTVTLTEILPKDHIHVMGHIAQVVAKTAAKGEGEQLAPIEPQALPARGPLRPIYHDGMSPGPSPWRLPCPPRFSDQRSLKPWQTSLFEMAISALAKPPTGRRSSGSRS